MIRSFASRARPSLALATKPRMPVVPPLQGQGEFLQNGTRTTAPHSHMLRTIYFSTSARRFERKPDTIVAGPELRVEQEKLRNQKLESDPSKVTSTSTITPIFSTGSPNQNNQDDTDMLAGIKSELNTVTETFALRDVPKEVYWYGIGGLTPYVVTSATTLTLAWDLNNAKLNGIGYFVNKDTAESLLAILEPTQIGLGAIILSFLGAIHWGLEIGKYHGSYPIHRYTVGIIAPVIAWPTVLLPLDYALVSQFAAFTAMYFADAKATTWGWVPKWYATYRFILTFVVGVSIMVTLIARGQIGDDITPPQRASRHLSELKEQQRRNLVSDQARAANERDKANREARNKDDEDDDVGEEDVASLTKSPKEKPAEKKGDENGTPEGGSSDVQRAEGKVDKQDPATKKTKESTKGSGKPKAKEKGSDKAGDEDEEPHEELESSSPEGEKKGVQKPDPSGKAKGLKNSEATKKEDTRTRG